MNHYQIVCREQQWHLMIEGHECALLQSDDRSYLVQIACKVAAERGAQVDVFDARNKLETRLSFRDGTLATDGSCPGDLAISADPGAFQRPSLL
ncbi:MAG: hypothetical protein ACREUZ_10175 [Burkholderiales bacterium]